VVHVRTVGRNQHREIVLDYVRWVMVNKRNKQSKAADERAPTLAGVAPADKLAVPPEIDCRLYDDTLAGSPHRWGDYAVGERIDHVDGITVEEAEHMMATRLYHNTARVHFNAFAAKQGRFGRRLIYGGHVISLARALSFNGLANAFRLVAINAGRHANPLFAGDTVFAWSEVLDKAQVAGRDDLGALRLRTVATKDRPCADFPDKGADGKTDPAVLLDFDYWALMPR
jgi:2-methylfumaryl-CoA hydratase